MLSHLSWAYVLGGILFSSLAQVCLKRATAYEGNWFWWIVLMGSSALSYLLAFVAYYLGLRYFPISKIAPIMTVGVIIIVVGYGMWAGESITSRHAIGISLGLLAIVIIVSS